jgi:hypothetical protein
MQVTLHAVIDDVRLQDGMHAAWSVDRVRSHVAAAAEALRPAAVRHLNALYQIRRSLFVGEALTGGCLPDAM